MEPRAFCTRTQRFCASRSAWSRSFSVRRSFHTRALKLSASRQYSTPLASRVFSRIALVSSSLGAVSSAASSRTMRAHWSRSSGVPSAATSCDDSTWSSCPPALARSSPYWSSRPEASTASACGTRSA